MVGQRCDFAPEDAVADDRVEEHQREDEQALSPEHERKTRLRRRRFVDRALYVNAIAISSGMSRWPATRWPASEAVRGRRATEGSRFGTVISASGIKRPRFGHAGIMSGRLLGHFEIVASSTFKWLGDHLRR